MIQELFEILEPIRNCASRAAIIMQLKKEIFTILLNMGYRGKVVYSAINISHSTYSYWAREWAKKHNFALINERSNRSE